MNTTGNAIVGGTLRSGFAILNGLNCTTTNPNVISTTGAGFSNSVNTAVGSVSINATSGTSTSSVLLVTPTYVQTSTALNNILGALTVSGTATFSGPVFIADSLSVGGVATVNGGIVSNGPMSLSSATSSSFYCSGPGYNNALLLEPGQCFLAFSASGNAVYSGSSGTGSSRLQLSGTSVKARASEYATWQCNNTDTHNNYLQLSHTPATSTSDAVNSSYLVCSGTGVGQSALLLTPATAELLAQSSLVLQASSATGTSNTTFGPVSITSNTINFIINGILTAPLNSVMNTITPTGVTYPIADTSTIGYQNYVANALVPLVSAVTSVLVEQVIPAGVWLLTANPYVVASAGDFTTIIFALTLPTAADNQLGFTGSRFVSPSGMTEYEQSLTAVVTNNVNTTYQVRVRIIAASVTAAAQAKDDCLIWTRLA